MLEVYWIVDRPLVHAIVIFAIIGSKTVTNLYPLSHVTILVKNEGMLSGR